MTYLRTLPHPDLDTPTVRMLTALLATCDPYGYVDEGNPPAAYTHTAWKVALRLEAGLGAGDIVEALAPSADESAAERFAWAALQWWADQPVARTTEVARSTSA